ncbi:MAG: hypothetical protein ACREVH_12280 [Gammaproteobacteria bacterium]
MSHDHILIPACRGARLKPEALLWRLGTKEDAERVLAFTARFRPAEVSCADTIFAALP